MRSDSDSPAGPVPLNVRLWWEADSPLSGASAGWKDKKDHADDDSSGSKDDNER